jgi:Leucine-rich repeat (LRR) protein
VRDRSLRIELAAENSLLRLHAVADNAAMQTEPSKADTPKRKRRWFQFSLRTMMVVVTLLCIWLGITANRANRQRRAVETITKAGGEVLYDYQTVTGARPPGPEWLRTLLGENFFSEVAAVGLNQSHDPGEGLANVREMAHLQWLVVGGKGVTDARLVNIKPLIKLKYLDLSTAKVTDVGFINLELMTELETLNLPDTNITDAGLVSLRGMTNLRTLDLQNTRVSDAGLVNLELMTELETLDLANTDITDAGLVNLKGMGKLRLLNMKGTKVSDGGLVSLKGLTQLQVVQLETTVVNHRIQHGPGVKELLKALPNCKVHYSDGETLPWSF